MTISRDLADLARIYSLGAVLGFKNRIINGSMAIDQRNNGLSVSSGVGAITYTLDRWSVATSGAAVSVQRLGVPGNYYLHLTGAAGNTLTNIRHRIEAANIADLAGKAVTVSFMCRASAAVFLNVTAGYTAAVDNFVTVTPINSVTRVINNTGFITDMRLFSVQFTLPNDAVNGVELIFGINNFTSGTFSITDVQIEPGSTATWFERRPIGMELALCQRYYETCVGGILTNGNVIGSYCGTSVTFAASKRAVPIVTRISDIAVTGVSTPYSEYVTSQGFRAVAQSTVNGQTQFHTLYAANAEL